MQGKVFDELISVDEWLRFFNMVPTKEIAEVQPEIVLNSLRDSNLNQLKALLSKLFVKLGYSKLDIVDKSSEGNFSITGESVRNGISVIMFCKVLSKEIVTQKSVKEAIKESAGSRASRTFIITKGKFEEGTVNLSAENVTLIDGLTLAKYVLNFNMYEPPAAVPKAE